MAAQVTIAELFADLTFRYSDKDLAKFERRVASAGHTIRNMGLALTAAGTAVATAAVKWEADFVKVAKTVDGTDAELNKLESDLRGLARTTPVSHAQLAAIAALGGQMDVAADF